MRPKSNFSSKKVGPKSSLKSIAKNAAPLGNLPKNAESKRVSGTAASGSLAASSRSEKSAETPIAPTASPLPHPRYPAERNAAGPQQPRLLQKTADPTAKVVRKGALPMSKTASSLDRSTILPKKIEGPPKTAGPLDKSPVLPPKTEKPPTATNSSDKSPILPKKMSNSNKMGSSVVSQTAGPTPLVPQELNGEIGARRTGPPSQNGPGAPDQNSIGLRKNPAGGPVAAVTPADETSGTSERKPILVKKLIKVKSKRFDGIPAPAPLLPNVEAVQVSRGKEENTASESTSREPEVEPPKNTAASNYDGPPQPRFSPLQRSPSQRSTSMQRSPQRRSPPRWSSPHTDNYSRSHAAESENVAPWERTSRSHTPTQQQRDLIRRASLKHKARTQRKIRAFPKSTRPLTPLEKYGCSCKVPEHNRSRCPLCLSLTFDDCPLLP